MIVTFKAFLDERHQKADSTYPLLGVLVFAHWKKILANYIDYGNEYGRHASEKRHEFNASEVEAYLYTTCILIRLIVKIST